LVATYGDVATLANVKRECVRILGTAQTPIPRRENLISHCDRFASLTVGHLPSRVGRPVQILMSKEESILAEPQRSGPAAGDEPEGLGQKLFRQMKGIVTDQARQTMNWNDARRIGVLRTR
jgi:hypothetical protein